jgi:hypothetical protein
LRSLSSTGLNCSRAKLAATTTALQPSIARACIGCPHRSERRITRAFSAADTICSFDSFWRGLRPLTIVSVGNR